MYTHPADPDLCIWKFSLSRDPSVSYLFGSRGQILGLVYYLTSFLHTLKRSGCGH